MGEHDDEVGGSREPRDPDGWGPELAGYGDKAETGVRAGDAEVSASGDGPWVCEATKDLAAEVALQAATNLPGAVAVTDPDVAS